MGGPAKNQARAVSRSGSPRKNGGWGISASKGLCQLHHPPPDTQHAQSAAAPPLARTRPSPHFARATLRGSPNSAARRRPGMHPPRRTLSATAFSLFGAALKPKRQLRRRSGRHGLDLDIRELEVLQELRDRIRARDRCDPAMLRPACRALGGVNPGHALHELGEAVAMQGQRGASTAGVATACRGRWHAVTAPTCAWSQDSVIGQLMQTRRRNESRQAFDEGE